MSLSKVFLAEALCLDLLAFICIWTYPSVDSGDLDDSIVLSLTLMGYSLELTSILHLKLPGSGWNSYRVSLTYCFAGLFAFAQLDLVDSETLGDLHSTRVSKHPTSHESIAITKLSCGPIEPKELIPALHNEAVRGKNLRGLTQRLSVTWREEKHFFFSSGFIRSCSFLLVCFCHQYDAIYDSCFFLIGFKKPLFANACGKGDGNHGFYCQLCFGHQRDASAFEATWFWSGMIHTQLVYTWGHRSSFICSADW